MSAPRELAQRFTLIASVGILSILGCIAGAEPISHPDPEVSAYYREHQEQIEALQRKVRNAELPGQERLGALQELRTSYPEALLSVLPALVADPNQDIALRALEFLVGIAVMSDHPSANHHGESSSNPYANHMTQRHDVARDALRRAALDKRKEIAVKAAEALSSLSDDAGLKAITQAAAQGVYSEADAAGLISLANSEKAAPYLESYLRTGSPSAKKAAVASLAKYPVFQEKIRSEYLFNPKADLELRKAAAKTLAKDSNNVLPLLIDPTVPPQLFSIAIETYVGHGARSLSVGETQAIREAVKNYGKQKPDVDLKEIEKALRDATEKRP